MTPECVGRGGTVANPKKILIVDDEPDVVGLVERTLRAEGFEVIRAYDGIGALDLISTDVPDLVLLDIMMPMMSGYEVCEQIKSNPQTRHIPVVCLSSAHTPDARAHSLRAGAVELITKPFMPAELVAQIRRHLRTRRSES
jgi:DNA-binding response OmpR family regulator